MAQKHLSVQYDGEIAIVRFRHHKILDEPTINEITEELSELVHRTHSPKLLISFEGVDHITSGMLGTLVRINGHIRQRDGQLRLVDISESIYEIFRITQLERVFQIHRSVDEAKETFSGP